MSKSKPRREFGNIRELKSKRWQARYQVGTAWVNAPSTFAPGKAGHAEAKRWLADVERSMQDGRWSNPLEAGDVEAAVTRYIERRKRAGERPLSPETVRTYELSLDCYIAGTELGSMNPTAVRPPHVDAWWRAMTDRDDDGKTAVTIPQAKKAYRLLKATFGMLEADEVIFGNPCRVKGAASNVKARKRIAGDGTVDAGEAELDAILKELDPRWHLLPKLGVWIGPRWGELRGLRRRDVAVLNDETAFVLIAEQLDRQTGSRRETKGRAETTVAVPPHLVAELVAHLETYVDDDADALLFTGYRGGPLSESFFGKKWREAQEKAGISERLHVHDLRRTHGTWLTSAAGATLADAMEQMGHATEAAAMSYQVSTPTRRIELAKGLSAARGRRTA